MRTYTATVNLGGDIKTLLVANCDGVSKEEKVKTVDRIHHIHILDFSYSMSGYLRSLGENVRQTIDLMSDNDLVSILWFSGEGENGIIGVPAMTKSDYIKNLADNFAPVGLTCFSEVLNGELQKIIEQFRDVCPNFNVTFFTDGETVTHHSREEEEKRIMEAMTLMRDNIMAFNTIGYGWYYNEDLLKRMSNTTAFGRMVHSTKIAEYSEIFARTRTVLNDMIVQRIEVDAPLRDILYLSGRAMRLQSDSMVLNFVDKKKNQFIFILDSVNDEVSIDGVTLSPVGAKSATEATLNNFFYAYASELFYRGDSELALKILAENVRDKDAVDGLMNAFTADERQKYGDRLRRMTFKNPLRSTNTAPRDYVPADDAFCVMDLLNVLSTEENYYVPVKEYNRIGLKVTDEFDLFRPDAGPAVAQFTDFVFNEKHLNLSIRYQIRGTVGLNPKRAESVGLPKAIHSKIWRNQTLIKDGNVNVPKFEAFVTRETLDALSAKRDSANPFFKVVDLHRYYGLQFDQVMTLIEIDLTRLPVINRMYAREADKLDTVLEVVKEIETLKAHQKVLKYYIDQTPAPFAQISTPIAGADVTKLNEELTDAQVEVLKEHGLNPRLEYVGVDNAKAEKEENDFYLSRLLSFDLKGWSSLPKVEDVIEKYRKASEAANAGEPRPTFNEPTMAMIDMLQIIELERSSTDRNALTARLDRVKRRVNWLKVRLNTLKIAKVLTGGWWRGLEVDAKDTRKSTYVSDGSTLIVKTDRVKVFYTA